MNDLEIIHHWLLRARIEWALTVFLVSAFFVVLFGACALWHTEGPRLVWLLLMGLDLITAIRAATSWNRLRRALLALEDRIP